MKPKDILNQNLQDSIDIKQEILKSSTISDQVTQIVQMIIDTYETDGKVLLAGNGGSAADAQHLAAELTGRYYYDRPPLYAEALHVNSSYTTAVSNDYGYEHIYSRLVEAMGRSGDIFMAFSTSGNSENVLNAAHAAKAKSMKVIGFTGEGGGQLKALCEVCITIPSTITPRIQECHMLIGHTICELVESQMFPR